MPIQYHHLLILITFFALISVSAPSGQKKTMQLLRLLVLLNLLFEIAATITWYRFNSNNKIIYNFVVGFSFPIWLLVLNNIHTVWRKKINTAIVCFILLYIVNLCVVQGLYIFNTYSFLLGTLLVTGFSLILLFYETENKIRLSNFDISVIYAGLIYFIGFSAMLFTNKWMATQIQLGSDFTLYQLVSYSVNTLFYGLLIYACLKLFISSRNPTVN